MQQPSPFGSQSWLNANRSPRGASYGPYTPQRNSWDFPSMQPPTAQDYLQEKFGGMMRRAGKGGTYHFGGMGFAPGRVSAYQTAPPQYLNVTPYGQAGNGGNPYYTPAPFGGQQGLGSPQGLGNQQGLPPQLLALLKQLGGQSFSSQQVSTNVSPYGF